MPLITITQSIGSEGRAVAKGVAEGLNIPLYDDAKLMEEAKRMGLDIAKLQGFAEKAPSWFDWLIGEKLDAFAHLMGAVIYESAHRGEGVILGHGSQVLLEDFSCAVHVLVTANEDRRIDNLSKKMSLSREAAAKLIEKSDKQYSGYFRYVFQKNWDDPGLYDLCVNPGKIGVEGATKTIIDLAGSPGLNACNVYAVDALKRFAIIRRIKASFIDRGVQIKGLQVEMPEKSLVQISGIVDNYFDKNSLMEIVKLTPGVERVDMDLLRALPLSYD
jgi:CMP/dCMP kinase